MSIKIGEGKKYDINEVSTEGVKLEDLQKMAKDKVKMQELFKAFDQNNDGTLNKLELVKAMDAFGSIDSNGNEKISNKEFKEIAALINKDSNLDGKDAISAKDLKSFFKSLVKLQKEQGTRSVGEVLDDVRKEATAKINALLDKDIKTMELKVSDEVIFEDEEINVDPVDIDVPPPSYSYTVQNGDTLKGLMIKVLKSQGIENPTKEEINDAIARFKEANPGAVKTNSKGVEYLIAGAKIKLEADLGDKNNKKEVYSQYEKILKENKLKQAEELQSKINSIDEILNGVEFATEQELLEDLKSVLPKGVSVDDVLLEITKSMDSVAENDPKVKQGLISYIENLKAENEAKLQKITGGKSIEDLKKDVVSHGLTQEQIEAQAEELQSKINSIDEILNGVEFATEQELLEVLKSVLPKGVSVDDVLLEITKSMDSVAENDPKVKQGLISYIENLKAENVAKLEAKAEAEAKAKAKAKAEAEAKADTEAEAEAKAKAREET